jgi:hypothetical protein
MRTVYGKAADGDALRVRGAEARTGLIASEPRSRQKSVQYKCKLCRYQCRWRLECSSVWLSNYRWLVDRYEDSIHI